MNVSEIMTQPVLAVSPDTPLTQAVRLMVQHGVSGVPVTGPAGELLGILTEGDLLRRAETGTADRRSGWLTRLLMPGREARDYVKTHGRRVAELMTDEVKSVSGDATLLDAVATMQRYRVKRLPVTRDGKLVGIISRADIVRRLSSLLPAEAVSSDDATIRTALLDAVDKQPWAPRNMARIAVTNGVVEFDGCTFDMDCREALTVLAENIPGVCKVENRMVWVDPYGGAAVYDSFPERLAAM